MESIIFDTQQIIILDCMESILRLIPIAKELGEDSTIAEDRSVPAITSQFHGKMVETKRNLITFYATMQTILQTQIVPHIRDTIKLVLPLRDVDTIPVAIENFISSGNYAMRSNRKIEKYNKRENCIAIESNYLIDSYGECWYDVTIEHGEIKIEKLEGATISLQNIIDHKLASMLDTAEGLDMFIGIEQKLHVGKYFSDASLQRISDVVHEKIMPSNLIGTIPNPAYLTEMYENAVKINSAMTALMKNINTVQLLISEVYQKEREVTI